jgi:hypothetical protein
MCTRLKVDTLSKRRDMHLAVTNRVDLGRRGANLVLVSDDRGVINLMEGPQLQTGDVLGCWEGTLAGLAGVSLSTSFQV